jgi:thiosulfate/3-mercaptopyruvate sulfurtransferase
MDLDADLSAHDGPGRHPLPSAVAFRLKAQAAGIGSHTTVVAYDDLGGTVAARLWWMLDNLGHTNTYILDGGIQAWTAAGFPVESGAVHLQPADELELANEWHNTIDRDELVSRMDRLTLLDGRAGDRYRGEVEPIDPKAGHIPTALSAPTGGNLDETGRFMTSAELRRRFESLNEADRKVVNSCGSGTSACHNIFAMRLAGLPESLLYVGSFSDWSRSDMPVAVGEEPGTLAEAAEAAEI